MNTKHRYLYGFTSLLMALLAFGGLTFAVARGVGSQPARAAVSTGGAGNHSLLDPSTPGDWPLYGHDLQRTNYNPDETIINSGNVSQLVNRWQMFIGSNGTPASSSPAVANGKVYVGSSASSGN